jgi:molybdenum cofactor cytidylyltransferase
MASQVYVAVLAAGNASRFGGLKQLALIDDKPMVVRAIEAASAACGNRALLIAGHECIRVAGACEGLPGFVAINENHDEGIGASIAAAVRRLQHVADAIVIMLADQPFVSGEHLRELIDAWDGADDRIVASGFSGTLGPPALFAKGCFADLARLRGDSGARALFTDPRFAVTSIGFEAAAADVDTPGDLRRIERNARS